MTLAQLIRVLNGSYNIRDKKLPVPEIIVEDINGEPLEIIGVDIKYTEGEGTLIVLKTEVL